MQVWIKKNSGKVSALLACVILIGGLIIFSNSISDPNTDHWVFRSDANKYYYAVTVDENKKHSTLVYDLNKNKWFKLSSNEYHISFPKFSNTRSTVLYLTARKNESVSIFPDEERDLENTVLLECDLIELNCKMLFSSPYLLAYPIDFTESGMVISAGKPNKWADHQNPKQLQLVYNDTDLYLISSSLKINRLTDWSLFQLNNLSLTKNGIIFAGFASAHTKMSIRHKISSDKVKSKIYRANIKMSSDGTIINENSEKNFSKPWISVGNSLTIHPSTIFEETPVAVLSAVSGIGQQWRYEVVVVDPITDTEILRLIPESYQSFIEPELVDNDTLLVGERFDDEIRLYQAVLSDKSKSTLSSVKREFISNMPSAIELTKLLKNSQDVPILEFSGGE